MILGIDPGAEGAIAFLRSQCGSLIDVRDMPTIDVKIGKTLRPRLNPHSLVELLKELRPEMCVIESVGGITGQSASAAFAFGHTCGSTFGVLVGLGFPVCLLPPQRWKKAFGLKKDKGSSRMMAMELFPEHAAKFSRVKDDGRAESALIGRHYWQATHKGR